MTQRLMLHAKGPYALVLAVFETPGKTRNKGSITQDIPTGLIRWALTEGNGWFIGSASDKGIVSIYKAVRCSDDDVVPNESSRASPPVPIIHICDIIEASCLRQYARLHCYLDDTYTVIKGSHNGHGRCEAPPNFNWPRS
jgi:hypothetical protein